MSQQTPELEHSTLTKSTYKGIPNLPALSDLTQFPFIQINDSSTQKLDIIDTNKLPEIKVTHKLKFFPNISFSEKIKREMIENSYFGKFISEIERGLFLFSENENSSINAKFDIEEDWEITELQNIILYIEFSNQNFDKELKLWKSISVFMRNILELNLISFDKKLHSVFKKYHKCFYIKLDLR